MPPRKKSLSLRSRLESLLLRPVSGEKCSGLLEEMGLSDARADYFDLVLAGLLKAAVGGSVPAFKELRELLGDEDAQQMFSQLDRILLALENAQNKEGCP